MLITCVSCTVTYVLSDALVAPEGASVRCTRCGAVFTVGTAALGSAPLQQRLEALEREARAVRSLMAERAAREALERAGAREQPYRSFDGTSTFFVGRASQLTRPDPRGSGAPAGASPAPPPAADLAIAPVEPSGQLTEVANVRPEPDGTTRRWFSSPELDLVFWLHGAQPVAFQLCFDKRGDEQAITWRQETGYAHSSGGRAEALAYASAPLLLGVERIGVDRALATLQASLPGAVPEPLSAFALARLREHPDSGGWDLGGRWQGVS